MTELEFRERYYREKNIYEQWGVLVTDTIVGELSKTEKVDEFLKMRPFPRVKEENSLVAKAFFRGKNYQDPYNEITDKVGARFVVLLVEHINVIKTIIQSCKLWDYSLDRDFEEERRQKPTLFEYQSIHYIVRNKQSIMVSGFTIPANTPCEIQIRTLLQHAYAELAHNTIYKPIGKVPPEVHRIIARSMALIETTDALFSHASEMIEMKAQEQKKWMDELTRLYLSIADSPQIVDKLNMFIYDAMDELVSSDDLMAVAGFIKEHSWLKGSVASHYTDNLLYRQPIVILLYYLIDRKQRTILSKWPLPEKYLEPLFTDLGYAMPS